MRDFRALQPSEAAPTRGNEQQRLSRAQLQACKAGDAEAFRSFVLAHERPVFALISRVVGRGVEVQDLAQEAFLRAYRAFPQFDLDGPAEVKTWLLTIAVRVALTSRKQAGRAPPLVPLARAWAESDRATPETERARRELGDAIARAANELSAEQRAAFVLAEFHGLTLAEIAAALEIRENTAKTRLFRARAHLRERLLAFEEEKQR